MKMKSDEEKFGVGFIIFFVGFFIGTFLYAVSVGDFSFKKADYEFKEIAENFCDERGYNRLYDVQLIKGVYYKIKCEDIFNYTYTIDDFDLYISEYETKISE